MKDCHPCARMPGLTIENSLLWGFNKYISSEETSPQDYACRTSSAKATQAITHSELKFFLSTGFREVMGEVLLFISDNQLSKDSCL